MRVHPAQRDDRDLRMAGEVQKALGPERWRSGMRARGIDWREQQRVGSQTVGKADFGQIVGSGKVEHSGTARIERTRRAITSVRTPLGCRHRAVGEDDEMLQSLRYPAQRLEPCPALWPFQVIMTVDKAACTRQSAQGVLQPCIIARVRYEPQIRQGR